jgi:hypothetical protein
MLGAWLWNPHTSDAELLLKLFGLFIAYPGLFVGFELRAQDFGVWISLPLVAISQFAWCFVLALPIQIIVSWAAARRSPSNTSRHHEAS